MVTNYFITPHPALSTFIDRYFLSTSGTDKIIINGVWAASHETSLVFYLSDKPDVRLNGNIVPENQNNGNWLVGILTRCNGIVSFNGHYKTFVIQFKANGFNKIFSMPVAGFTNTVFSIDDVFGIPAASLYEQLLNAGDIQQMAGFADQFLLRFIKKQKSLHLNDGITAISNRLQNGQILDVARCADLANMSLRNFERRFSEQVGVSPKLFCRLLRFNNTVNTKIRYPERNWTTIAHDHGYYDQMHMIKDFKDFADATPSTFFSQNAGTSNEKFVTIKRTSF